MFGTKAIVVPEQGPQGTRAGYPSSSSGYRPFHAVVSYDGNRVPMGFCRTRVQDRVAASDGAAKKKQPARRVEQAAKYWNEAGGPFQLIVIFDFNHSVT